MPISDYMRRIREKIGTQLLEIPSVTILAFDERDRVLLVRHAESGLWATPGGGVEPLEVPADAALREMWEETGLHVELLRTIGVYGGPGFRTTYDNGDAVSFMMTVFLARVVGGRLRPDGEEVSEVRAFTREEVKTLPLQGWAPRVIENAFADRERAFFDAPTWRPPAG